MHPSLKKVFGTRTSILVRYFAPSTFGKNSDEQTQIIESPMGTQYSNEAFKMKYHHCAVNSRKLGQVDSMIGQYISREELSCHQEKREKCKEY